MPVAFPSPVSITLQELDDHPAFRFDSPGGARFRRETGALLMQIREDLLIQPKSVSAVHRIVRKTEEFIELEDGPRLVIDDPDKLEGAHHLSVVIGTIGDGVSHEIAALQAAGQHLRAVLLDALGNHAVLKLARQVAQENTRMAKSIGLKTTTRLNPGDGVFRLEQQAEFVALAGASKIGVSVATGTMMNPRHSLSAGFGLGEDIDVLHPDRECDACRSRHRCPHARAARTARQSASCLS